MQCVTGWGDVLSLALELLNIGTNVLSTFRRLLHFVFKRVDVFVVLTQRITYRVLNKSDTHVT